MKVVIDIIGELTLENGLTIVDQIRDVYDFNNTMLETYVEPPEFYGEVELVICSNGGEFRALSLIMDEVEKLKELGVKIITRASAMAYSAGLYLMLLGEVREANSMTSLMLHEFQLSTGFDSLTGNIEYLEHQRKIQDNLDEWVISRTNITREQLDELRGKDKFLTRDECIELGILTKPEENKKNEMVLTTSECVEILNQSGYKVVEDSKMEIEGIE
ncbi:MAG: ATP-dependent Clp protease proteolytic subunit [Sarcina sp.]